MSAEEPQTEEPSPLLVGLTIAAVLGWVLVDTLVRARHDDAVDEDLASVEEALDPEAHGTADGAGESTKSGDEAPDGRPADPTSAHLLIGDDVIPWLPLSVAARLEAPPRPSGALPAPSWIEHAARSGRRCLRVDVDPASPIACARPYNERGGPSAPS
ncbi:MAG: hypothetical protein R3B09_30845 [Nannocystaceae bacterium]